MKPALFSSTKLPFQLLSLNAIISYYAIFQNSHHRLQCQEFLHWLHILAVNSVANPTGRHTDQALIPECAKCATHVLPQHFAVAAN